MLEILSAFGELFKFTFWPTLALAAFKLLGWLSWPWFAFSGPSVFFIVIYTIYLIWASFVFVYTTGVFTDSTHVIHIGGKDD